MQEFDNIKNLNDHYDIWGKEQESEINFWIKTILKQYNESNLDKSRLNPNRPFEENLKKYANSYNKKELNILDVGSGPLTVLGSYWEGVKCNLTCVDPLADKYNMIFEKINVIPLVKPMKGDVEKLDKLFPENSFDFVFMRNALDHSYNPVLGIKQMLRLVKPNNYVYLRHRINEAEDKEYTGLHQWNLDYEGNNFIIWDKSSRVDINETLGKSAEITIIPLSDDKSLFNVILKKQR